MVFLLQLIQYQPYISAMKKKFQNTGGLFRQPLQKKRKTEKNQQTLIDTTENCSNDEINIDCGCENTSSIIATEHSYCKLESANVWHVLIKAI